MKIFAILTILVSFNSQAFWDSELSDDVDRFIFENTNFQCDQSSNIDQIIVSEIDYLPEGEIYYVEYVFHTRSHSRLSGEIIVSKNYLGELELDSLSCPTFEF